MRQFRVDETLEHHLLFDIGFIIHHLMLGDVERSTFDVHLFSIRLLTIPICYYILIS